MGRDLTQACPDYQEQRHAMRHAALFCSNDDSERLNLEELTDDS